MYTGLHVKYPSFLSVIKLECFPYIFEKHPTIKFLENPSIGCRVVAWEQTDR